MAKSKSNTKPVDELNYEEAVLELEQIVDALEGDSSQNSLEEAMKLFERGQALAMRCSELLDAAQLKVQKLVGDELSAFEDESQ